MRKLFNSLAKFLNVKLGLPIPCLVHTLGVWAIQYQGRDSQGKFRDTKYIYLGGR